MKFNKLIALGLMTLTAVPTALASTGDTTTGTLMLSGNVPEVFSMQIRTMPGVLDFSKDVHVVDRLLGILHINSNQDFTMTVAASTLEGVPLNAGGTRTPWGLAAAADTTDFAIKYSACNSILAGAGGTFDFDGKAGNATVDISPTWAAAPGAVFSGVDEDCNISVAYDGPATIAAAGKYSMNLTFVLTAK